MEDSPFFRENEIIVYFWRAEKIDEPPNYKAIVMKIDPPDYFESIVNQEINPQLNKNWAKHLHEKSVAPEIDAVINRYIHI